MTTHSLAPAPRAGVTAVRGLRPLRVLVLAPPWGGTAEAAP